MSEPGLVALADRSGPFVLAAGSHGYELLAGGELAGRLVREGASGTGLLARSARGSWRFAGDGFLRPRVAVTDAASGEEVASLRARGVSGARGTVTVAGRELAYRARGALADRWELLDGDRTLVAVTTLAGVRDERFELALATPPPDDLLVLIACYGALQNSAAAAASAAT